MFLSCAENIPVFTEGPLWGGHYFNKMRSRCRNLPSLARNPGLGAARRVFKSALLIHKKIKGPCLKVRGIKVK